MYLELESLNNHFELLIEGVIADLSTTTPLENYSLSHNHSLTFILNLSVIADLSTIVPQ